MKCELSQCLSVILFNSYSGLVHAYDAGTKTDPSDVDTAHCRAEARNALDCLLKAKLEMIQPYLDGAEDIDFKDLPPFLTYLVYKCAATVTEKIRVGEESLFNLRVLKGLRGFLSLLSQRWLAGSKFSLENMECFGTK